MEVIGYGGNGGGTLINMVKRLNENNMPCTHFMVLGLRFGDIRNMLKNKIRESVFKRIKGVSFTSEYPGGIFCTIKWDTFNKKTSTMYYISSAYDEQFIRKTTKAMFRKIYTDVNSELIPYFPAVVDYQQLWSMGFIVGKNSSFSINDLDNRLNNQEFSNYEMIDYIMPDTPLHIEAD